MFDLLERAKDGCEDSISAICEIAEASARRSVFSKIFRHRTDGDDVVQDSLYEVARDLQKCRATSQVEFESWVARLAWNNMHKAWRKHRATKRGGRETISTLAIDVGVSDILPIDKLIFDETHQSMVEIIRSIEHSEANQELVDRVVFQGESITEVAGELGITKDAAHGVVKRLRKRVREAVGCGDSD